MIHEGGAFGIAKLALELARSVDPVGYQGVESSKSVVQVHRDPPSATLVPPTRHSRYSVKPYNMRQQGAAVDHQSSALPRRAMNIT